MSSSQHAENSMAVVKFQPSPGPTHWRLMVGRLFAEVGGMLFYPFGALRRWTGFAFHNDTLPEGSLSSEQEEWCISENARKFLAYAKSFTPRLLFRGFTPDSGGGDARLNGPHGVIPHGFLDGKIATSMWNVTGLFEMIDMHLDQDPDIISDFSSWSQMWTTALNFSDYPHDNDGRIAVVDTTSIEEHVWHTVDLARADMAVEEFDDEYIIYGPITGPKYHCISPQDLYRTTRIRDLLQDAPFVFGEDPGSCAIERRAVQTAMDVAAFLQPRGACVENLTILTARFVSYRAALISSSDRRELMAYVDIDTYLHHVRDHVQYLAMNTEDGEIHLVDDTMFTRMQWLRFEVQLLQAVENAVRIKAHEIRVTMWEICRLQSMGGH